MFLKFYCQVTEIGVQHSGAVEVYDHTDYQCLRVGQHHYFCELHHQPKNCPIDSEGYRLK